MSKTKNKGKDKKDHGPLEWLYIAEDRNSMRDLYALLDHAEEFTVEYWEEAGVLEVSREAGGGLDLERSEEENVYWVTLSPRDYSGSVAAMEKMKELCGGNFLMDE